MKKSVKDYTDAAALRRWYAAMSPSERENWLQDNPNFKADDHSDLTVLQWREHAAIRKARSTDAAHAFADAIRKANFVRRATGNLGLSRGGAAFTTLSGVAIKGALFVPGAYALGGGPMAAIAAIALLIYATVLILGSIIISRPL